jgi:uncharacterized ParB-like nuclease family protein
MRRIELATSTDVPKRVESCKRSLEIIYNVKLEVVPATLRLDTLYPTEDFLENSKLAMVLRAVVRNNYAVPIITAETRGCYFVLDGHHRAYVFKKLRRETIKANVLRFPEGSCYRNVPKRLLDDLPIKQIETIDDPILKAWAGILTVMKHYEAMYDIPFYLEKEIVPLETLLPTQPQVLKSQINAIKTLLVPITCVRYEGEYYVLDGHARSLRAKELGLETIEAIVVCPHVRIDFGIIKTAKEMRLNSLKDVQIIE